MKGDESANPPHQNNVRGPDNPPPNPLALTVHQHLLTAALHTHTHTQYSS